ncbi:MAG TPA: hypothetical protein P5270_08460 [Victivallales bacterium]|nr:hypothetical protein [Victivallales bacterium]
MAWIHAELHFSGLFSYRIPNLSPSYALTSIIPSPSAVRLALVETAIRSKGSVNYGEEMFELIKVAPLEIEPPDRVSVLKFFIKRLKPSKSKEKGFEISFGVREYCHFLGPMKIYMRLKEREEEVRFIFRQLGRLGTTDSTLRCEVSLSEKEPELSNTIKVIGTLKPEFSNLSRRPVVSLKEIKKDTDFSQINPYSQGRRGEPYISVTYVLPLREIKKGENFVLYEKVPFIVQ